MDYLALMKAVTRLQVGKPECSGDWTSCECAGCESEREHHWLELASEDARMERNGTR